MSALIGPRFRGLAVLMWLAALAAAVTFATVPETAKPQDDDSGSKVLRIGFSQEATELGVNPLKSFLPIDYTLMSNNYDLLTAFDREDLTPAPDLAESWETSSDGLTWTFNIRDGVQWQDGTPLTAEDVAFTLNYIKESYNPDYRGPWAPDGNDVSGGGADGSEPDGLADNTIRTSYLDMNRGYDKTRIQSIEATDESTVVFKLSAPLTTLSQIYIPILPKHIWNTIPWVDANNKPLFEETGSVGSGPFQIVEYKPKELIRLKANPNYFDGAPKVDELLYVYYSSPDAAVQALRSGEVDILLDIPTSQYKALDGQSDIEVIAGQSLAFVELGFQSWAPTPERFKTEGCASCERGPTTGSMSNPWLTRGEVRSALASLIDKQELVDKALNGLGEPGVSLINPALSPFGYSPPEDDPLVYPEDGGDDVRAQRTDEARKTFESLGFEDTDGNGILNVPDDPESQAFDPDGAGKDFVLRLFVIDTNSEDQFAGDLLKQWFEEAGVGIDKQLVKESDVLVPAVLPSESNADSDLFIWNWVPNPDPDFILSVLSTPQINQASDVNWSDAKYDEIVSEQSSTPAVEDRTQLVKDAQQLAFAESPYSVLWYRPTIQAYRTDSVSGLSPFPEQGGVYWSQYAFGSNGNLTTVELGSSDSSSSSTGIIVGIVVLVGIGLLALLVVARRRRRMEQD